MITDRGQVAHPDAVSLHGGEHLDQHPRRPLELGRQAADRGQVLDPRHRGDHPSITQQRTGNIIIGPPRHHDHDVPGEPLPDLRDLRREPDRDPLGAEQLRLVGQAGQTETVPVSLGHRDHPGRRRGTVARCRRQRLDRRETQTPSPAVSHVDVEGRVDQRTEREFPLPDVLDRLAPAADLELDQPEVRVVGPSPR